MGVISKHEDKTVIHLFSVGDRISQALTEGSKEIVSFGVFLLLWLSQVLVPNEMAAQNDHKWVKIRHPVLVSVCEDYAQFYSWFPGSHQFLTDQHQAAADSPGR